MTKKKIWFGNAEKMMWVNCPSTNITRGRARWQESGTYLNGGAFEKSSPMSHRKYSIDWNLMESYEAAKIMSFYEGVYGQSPIQFVDPFAAKSNILPLHWSTPRLCAEGAAPTIGNAAPSTVAASNTLGYPTQSAVFSLTGASTPSVQIPVPPGKNLHFGARGSASGTAAISVTSSKGNPVIARNLATNPSFESTSGTVEVARNLVPNPSFETGVAGVVSGTGVTVDQSSVSRPERVGDYLMRINTGEGVASNQGYVFQNFAVSGLDGQWAAFSALVGRSVAVSHGRVSLRFSGPDAVLAQVDGPMAVLPGANLNRLTVAVQVPAGTIRVRVFVMLYGDEAGTTGPQAGTALTDAWMLTTAATEAEALAQAQAYFDGGTSPDPDLTPSWTGTAHGSASMLTGVKVSGAIVASTTKAISSTRWASSGARSVRTIPQQNTRTDTSVVVAGNSANLGQFEAGKTYTALVRMRLDAAQTGTLSPKARRIELYHNNVAGWAGTGSIISDAAPNVAGEHEIRFTFTIPPDSVWASLRLVNGAALGGGDVWWDNFAVIEGEYTGPWFDGSNPPSGYESAWDGAANASTSFYRERTTAVLSPLTETEQTTMVLNDPGTVTVKLTGSGSLTLNSMTATIGSTPPKSGVFRQGEGNTGLKFVGEPTRTGYSSVMDLESVSAEFVEVGAWQ